VRLLHRLNERLGPRVWKSLALAALSVGAAAACEPQPGMFQNMMQPGCDTLMAGRFNCSFTNGRTYVLERPASAMSQPGSVPLVIDAHGFGGTASGGANGTGGQRGQSGWLQLATQRGFVVAYPQGVGNAFNAQGACCDFSNVQDDVGFFRAIVTRTFNAGRIDPSRVFATGFSNGGSMAHTMACTSADMFAAVAPVSFSLAGPGGPANTAMVAASCRPVRPITMIEVHGTADTVANFNAGLLDSLPAPQSLVGWSMVNGCTNATGTVTRFTSNTTCEIRTSGCRGGTRVGLCTVQGGPHNVYPFVANTGMTVPQIVYPMLLEAASARQ
jgi:polyhydroxybutyrate depolymerase